LILSVASLSGERGRGHGRPHASTITCAGDAPATTVVGLLPGRFFARINSLFGGQSGEVADASAGNWKGRHTAERRAARCRCTTAVDTSVGRRPAVAMCPPRRFPTEYAGSQEPLPAHTNRELRTQACVRRGAGWCRLLWTGTMIEVYVLCCAHAGIGKRR
jgi:hypothetical protein